MSKRAKYILATLTIIAVATFFIYRYLFPAGPNLDPVANPITDRSVKDWSKAESDIERNRHKEVFFGDLHIHTKYSFDAYIGGTRTSPSDAYRFAKGEEINVYGKPVKIVRPLDFAGVTDHSEYFGEFYSINHKEAPGHGAFLPRYLRSLGVDTIKQRNFFNRLRQNSGGEKVHLDFFKGYQTTASAWNIQIEAAEEHYQPGEFTTLAGYEWTLSTDRAHTHRNVFFKDMNVPAYPISAIEARNEEQLWTSLDKMRDDGAIVMAIPHNSNLSNGTAFPATQNDGSAFSMEYIKTRNRNEPLAEIHQVKGNSEVSPEFWESDEYADYEYYEQGNAKRNNYLRHILKRGIEYKKAFGTNPYEYGLIGSTDTHNGTPGNTEKDDDYLGNYTLLDDKAVSRSSRNWILDRSKKVYEAVNPGALVAVWAEANTRSDIYDAMTRRETYATSGGRMKIRFFAGYEFSNEYLDYKEMVADGYANGVPMGSTLNIGTSTLERRADQSPQFIVWAAKDPQGAKLDRIQIIKGWHDGKEIKEKIFNVLLSDERVADSDGSVVGLTKVVDLSTGDIKSDVGANELSGVWTDPDFEAEQHAFYYMRVLEIESPRYTLIDELKYGVNYPDDVAKTVHERAWSSPIWINP